MCGGNKSQTTTSSGKFESNAAPQLQSLISRATDVSNNPYNPATQQQVAGFTAPQNQAFGAISGGLMSPYLGQAGQYAQQGAGTITPQMIQQYQNPFENQVVGNMISDFNTQNQQTLDAAAGKRAAQGALGNRTGADALIMQGAQDAQSKAIAQARMAGWSGALGAADRDRGAAQWGTQAQLGLGQSAFADPSAQLSIGNQQQAQQQKVYDTASANAAAQSAYPFQTTQWLASILNPTAGTMGGTQTGTQTQPGPSILGQIAGLGMTGLGIVGGTGGFGPTGWLTNWGKAAGGSVSGAPMTPYMGAASYIPQAQIQASPPRQMQMPQSQPASNPVGEITGMLRQMVPALKAMREFKAPTNPGTAPINPGTDASLGFGNSWSPMVQDFTPGAARGGRVIDMMPSADGMFVPRGYAEGGAPFAPYGGALHSFASGPYGIQTPEIAPPQQPPQQMPPQSALPTDTSGGQQMPTPSLLGVEPSQLNPSGGINSPPARERDSYEQFGASPWMALMSAGLGTMASKSPWAGVALGEGGLHGVKTIGEQMAQRMKEREAEMRAQQMAEQVRQFSLSHGLQKDQLAETSAHHRALENAENWTLVNNPLTGDAVMYNKKTGEMKSPSGSSTPSDAIGMREWAKEMYTKHLPAAAADFKKAGDMVDNFDLIEKLLPHMVTGQWADKELTARKFLQRLNVGDPNKIHTTELAQTILQQGILEQLKQMKPATDLDAQFAAKAALSIDKDPTTLQVMLPGLRAAAARSQLRAQMEQDFIKRNIPPAKMTQQIEKELERRIPSPYKKYAAQLELGRTDGPAEGPKVVKPHTDRLGAAPTNSRADDAIAELRSFAGSPDLPRRMKQFNDTFNGGRPGLAESIMENNRPTSPEWNTPGPGPESAEPNMPHNILRGWMGMEPT